MGDGENSMSNAQGGAASAGLQTKPRVLMVDDEPDIQRLLTFNLREAGFETESAGTGGDGLSIAAAFEPAVVILDLMLPDQSGTEVCRQLRSSPTLADTAILMLTARGDEYDRVLGFEVGADDYVVKPFSVREVVMRVRGLAKRADERRRARALDKKERENDGDPVDEAGAHDKKSGGPGKSARDKGTLHAWRGLVVDPVRHHVFVDGTELLLRPLEFKLLSLFLEHPGVVFSRVELLEEVWGITAEVNTRTVDTHIRRLRERLGPYGDAVETVHGFGYRLAER
jgi:two-component system phosphate regulon response regulator PhoB